MKTIHLLTIISTIITSSQSSTITQQDDSNQQGNEQCLKDTQSTQSSSSIIHENSLQGTPSNEWDINGSGDPSIQGFTTQTSYGNLDNVEFKVNTTSTNWTIEIYRMGWYDGLGAR
jgi:hypothetical protein